ncbi:OsmC family protein [Neisseria flava]|nr:OsmC family protein [Neisseria flava]OFJ61924.1 osmotically inducible protein OsmC [Neisseria sp. HMSC073B07]
MGGENAAPNQMEYLIGAAAGCCSIGFELQAAQAGVKLEQFEISARGGIDMAKLFGMEDGYGGLDNLVLTVKVKADADFPTLQNFADRSAANSPVLNSLKARAKVVVEKI